MSTAICKACGSLKSGVFVRCSNCGEFKVTLLLNSHFLNDTGVLKAAKATKDGGHFGVWRVLNHLPQRLWLVLAFGLAMAIFGGVQSQKQIDACRSEVGDDVNQIVACMDRAAQPKN